MKANLISEDPLFPNLELDVDEQPVVLGRSVSAQVRVPDPMVSRRHCEIGTADGRLLVRDLGSTNGTIVNGRIVHDAPLQPGDRILLGMTPFVVSYDADDPFGCPEASASRT